jgi:hypothetical protein
MHVSQPARMASSWTRSLRAWNKPVQLDAAEDALAEGAELLGAVLADVPGLPERSAPFGASVNTFGVET